MSAERLAKIELLNERDQILGMLDREAKTRDLLMGQLGYDIEYTSTDYINEGPAALGNYIAEKIIEFGYQDGANEDCDYCNQYYAPFNVDMIMDNPGNPNCLFPNNWQPLWIVQYIDQANNPVAEVPDFLSPEWGEVVPFSLTNEDMTIKVHETDDTGQEWKVYMDPLDPPYIDPNTPTDIEDPYKWGHTMVSVWSGHLDPYDGVMWDISPASIGNIDINTFPQNFEDYDLFYDFIDGGDIGEGWETNPSTGMPYEPQMVPRGDYGRILAEFWADGPDSETPPGHWFTILNYVTDHQDNTFQWEGMGDPLDELEWDIRSYFVMGGNMHDCAIAAWSIKGYYDYIRPVSAIRYMADQGQSTDPFADNYHPAGIPLVEDYVETVQEGDPLAGPDNENVGKIKVYAWKGPDYIVNPNIDEAGVDWILAENWWPYQRPTFVTPPFAGYVSGHSTYSRGAAEVMTLMTGSEFFPGGMGIFEAPENEFLVFEDGPSMDIELQWASYRDASDQCSLSRIWGGIHPPADDLPGRIIGNEIGPQAYDLAMQFMTANAPRVTMSTAAATIADSDLENPFVITVEYDEDMDTLSTPMLTFINDDLSTSLMLSETNWTSPTTAEFVFTLMDGNLVLEGVDYCVTGALDLDGIEQDPYLVLDQFAIDTDNPLVAATASGQMMITDADDAGTYEFTVDYDQEMDNMVEPTFSFPMEDASATLTFNSGIWAMDNMSYTAQFDIADANEELNNVDVAVDGAVDLAGNAQDMFTAMDQVNIDTKNPGLALLSPDLAIVTASDTEFSLIIIFDEPMNTDVDPLVSFPVEDPTAVLTLADEGTEWINDMTFVAVFAVSNGEEVFLEDIDVEVSGTQDANGNAQVDIIEVDQFDINTVVTGVEENAYGINNIYPNPVTAGSDLIVTLDNMPQNFRLQLFNTAGQVVFSQQYNGSLNQANISTKGIAAGSYFVHLQSDLGQEIFQIEIVR